MPSLPRYRLCSPTSSSPHSHQRAQCAADRQHEQPCTHRSPQPALCPNCRSSCEQALTLNTPPRGVDDQRYFSSIFVRFPDRNPGTQRIAESCGACLRREQARRNLTEDLLVVSGYRPLHMNTSTLYACFLRQPLELTLKKDFQLLRCQDGNRNSRRLACLGLDPHAVWGFGLLRFGNQTIPFCLARRMSQARCLAFYPVPPLFA